MRILLIRHADPYYPTDSLTPAGLREAAALAEHLAALGLDELYASPRGRARLTAQYTADVLAARGGCPPVGVLDWTTELDGMKIDEYDRALWNVDGDLLRGPQAAAILAHPRLAEHVQNIQAGSDAFLARQGFTRDGAVYRFSQPNRKRIALFAHLGFGLTWLAGLLAIPLALVYAGFYLHPSSITTILFDERRPGIAVPRVIGLGEIPHLHRAGLPPSSAGIIANID